MAIVTVRPGKPFWLAFTAFAANMIGLIGVDTLSITEADIVVSNWWVAIVMSVIVGGAVYGKAKVDEQTSTDSTTSDGAESS